MLVIALVTLANVISPHHDWRASSDLRNCDGARYLAVCVGRYQKAETWSCVSVEMWREV